jgi:hypothetical protein
MILALFALASADPLPDLEATARRGACETAAGGRTAVGADQTYAGQFTRNADGTITGYERRLLFANSTWRQTVAPDGTSGRDCRVHWTVTGTSHPPSARCPSCAFGVTFEANVDFGASTCPVRISSDAAHFRAAYDVEQTADGAVTVRFADSGRVLGTGRTADGELRWISEPRCVWL